MESKQIVFYLLFLQAQWARCVNADLSALYKFSSSSFRMPSTVGVDLSEVPHVHLSSHEVFGGIMYTHPAMAVVPSRIITDASSWYIDWTIIHWKYTNMLTRTSELNNKHNRLWIQPGWHSIQNQRSSSTKQTNNNNNNNNNKQTKKQNKSKAQTKQKRYKLFPPLHPLQTSSYSYFKLCMSLARGRRSLQLKELSLSKRVLSNR